MSLHRIERLLFRVCWVLWRLGSPSGLVISFMTFGTLAMALRPSLHVQLSTLNNYVLERLPPSSDQEAELSIAAMDHMIAATVFLSSILYLMLTVVLLDGFDWLLHLAHQRAKRRA